MSNARRLASIVTLLLALSAPLRAFAADTPTTTDGDAAAPAAEAPSAPRRFGARGQVMLDNLFGYTMGTSFGGEVTSFVGAGRYCMTNAYPGGQPNHGCTTNVSLTPSLDVGIGGGFTLGGTLLARLRVTSEETYEGFSGLPPTSLALGLSPRIGYVVALNDDLAFWPRIGGGVAISGDDVYEGSQRSWHVDAEAPLVFRAGRYVYFSATPKVSYFAGAWGNESAYNGGHANHVGLAMSGSLGIVLGT